MKKENEPVAGTRFWHEEYSEYCYLHKIMPDGKYLVCLNPRRKNYDDYYLYDKSELKIK